jgi:glycosyltransferase involved in cell wall biosynthesis
MRVVMVSKALVVGAYQRKAEEIAALGVDLTVFVPPFWQDRRGRQTAQARHTKGYHFRILPLRWNGNFHLHYYPTLAQELAQCRPDVLHMDEEPYNLATWLALRVAQRVGAASTFFTWQNLYRRYPPPFAWWERANYRRAPWAIAGNQEAATILRRKGFNGAIATIPQFGVDPNFFTPFAPHPIATLLGEAGLRIGYAGGLLPEKGVDLLLRACAALQGAWTLSLVGEGSEQLPLQSLAQSLGIAQRVHFLGQRESSAMVDFYRTLDVLVLPSRTQANWKEQFGRVLIEAMACEVAVIGSSSGEIPNVIGEAGLLFPEGEFLPLQRHLQMLLDDSTTRQRLGLLGRQRVLAHYTMRNIAEQTVAVYRQLA